MMKSLFLIGTLFTLAAIAFKAPDQTAWEFAAETASKVQQSITNLDQKQARIVARQALSDIMEPADVPQLTPEITPPVPMVTSDAPETSGGHNNGTIPPSTSEPVSLLPDIPVAPALTARVPAVSPTEPEPDAVIATSPSPRATIISEPVPLPPIPARSAAEQGPAEDRTPVRIRPREGSIDEGTYRTVRAFYENASRLLAEIK